METVYNVYKTDIDGKEELIAVIYDSELAYFFATWCESKEEVHQHTYTVKKEDIGFNF
jgi:hypothetical protein